MEDSAADGVSEDCRLRGRVLPDVQDPHQKSRYERCHVFTPRRLLSRHALYCFCMSLLARWAEHHVPYCMEHGTKTLKEVNGRKKRLLEEDNVRTEK